MFGAFSVMFCAIFAVAFLPLTITGVLIDSTFPGTIGLRAGILLFSTSGAMLVALLLVPKIGPTKMPSLISRNLGMKSESQWALSAFIAVIALAIYNVTKFTLLRESELKLDSIGLGIDLVLFGFLARTWFQYWYLGRININELSLDGVYRSVPGGLTGEVSENDLQSAKELGRLPVPRVESILIPKDLVGDAPAVYEYAVDYFDIMVKAGCYPDDKIFDKLRQAFHADFYLAQVLNGGHSQFVHNCGPQRDRIFQDVGAALKQSGLSEHLSIFNDMLHWEQSHPEEADQQTGFTGGRSPSLDDLDSRLYMMAEDLFFEGIADWVLSWPETEILEHSQVTERLTGLKERNPLYQISLIGKTNEDAKYKYNKLRTAIENKRFFITSAAFSQGTKLQVLNRLSESKYTRRVDGRQAEFYSADTNEGKFDILIGEKKIGLYRREGKQDDTAFGALQSDVMTVDVGPLIAEMPIAPLLKQYDVARAFNAVDAVFLLVEIWSLRPLGIVPMGILHRKKGVGSMFAVLQFDKGYLICVDTDGAFVTNMEGDKLIGYLTKNEIDRFRKANQS